MRSKSTETMNEIYTDDEFGKFVDAIYGNINDLRPLLNEFDGRCSFCIVFEEMNEKPCISLSKETIEKLYNIGARFDVDFN